MLRFHVPFRSSRRAPRACVLHLQGQVENDKGAKLSPQCRGGGAFGRGRAKGGVPRRRVLGGEGRVAEVEGFGGAPAIDAQESLVPGDALWAGRGKGEHSGTGETAVAEPNVTDCNRM